MPNYDGFEALVQGCATGQEWAFRQSCRGLCPPAHHEKENQLRKGSL